MKTLVFVLLMLAGCASPPTVPEAAPASPTPTGIEMLRFYATTEALP